MVAIEMLTIVILALTVIAFVADPLLRRYQDIPEEVGELSREAEDLYSRKESTYSALKELEFDFRTGKLSRTDFDELDAKYRAEALQLIEAIDSYESEESASAKAGDGGSADWEPTATESGRSARPSGARSRVQPSRSLPSGRQRSARSATARAAEAVAVAEPYTCECGFVSEEGARFCAACGEPIDDWADDEQDDVLDADGDGQPFCQTCGAEMGWEHRFCAECGAPAEA
jgi:hypothetical protein